MQRVADQPILDSDEVELLELAAGRELPGRTVETVRAFAHEAAARTGAMAAGGAQPLLTAPALVAALIGSFIADFDQLFPPKAH